MHSILYCISCGSSQPSVDARFCYRCGNPLPEEIGPSVEPAEPTPTDVPVAAPELPDSQRVEQLDQEGERHGIETGPKLAKNPCPHYWNVQAQLSCRYCGLNMGKSEELPRSDTVAAKQDTPTRHPRRSLRGIGIALIAMVLLAVGVMLFARELPRSLSERNVVSPQSQVITREQAIDAVARYPVGESAFDTFDQWLRDYERQVRELDPSTDQQHRWEAVEDETHWRVLMIVTINGRDEPNPAAWRVEKASGQIAIDSIEAVGLLPDLPMNPTFGAAFSLTADAAKLTAETTLSITTKQGAIDRVQNYSSPSWGPGETLDGRINRAIRESGASARPVWSSYEEYYKNENDGWVVRVAFLDPRGREIESVLWWVSRDGAIYGGQQLTPQLPPFSSRPTPTAGT